MKASTPSSSIKRAAVSRIASASTVLSPALLGLASPLRWGAVRGLTPRHAIRLGQIEIAFEVAVRIDHAPFLVGQRQMREPRLMQTALKSRQHRDVLGQHQTGVCLVGLQSARRPA